MEGEMMAATEDELDLKSARFPITNRHNDIADYESQLESEDTFSVNKVEVVEVVELLAEEMDKFKVTLLQHRDWLKGKGGLDSTAEGDWRDTPYQTWTPEQKAEFQAGAYRLVVEVKGPDESLYVDPQGTNHAFFVGFPINLSEHLDDPWPEPVEDPDDPEEKEPLEKETEPEQEDEEEDEAEEEELPPAEVYESGELPPMTEEMLDSGVYFPAGTRCAFCGERRGDDSVCQHCELACGDPCSRCDSGLGPDQHCPCCAPCAEASEEEEEPVVKKDKKPPAETFECLECEEEFPKGALIKDDEGDFRCGPCHRSRAMGVLEEDEPEQVEEPEAEAVEEEPPLPEGPDPTRIARLLGSLDDNSTTSDW
jgi:hypothetical protein